MSFSIITCSYNPDMKVFERLVTAIDQLITNGAFLFEWIIVDNNSKKAIGDIEFIREAIADHENYRVINESNPGLTNARITGIENSSNKWIVFFDDDNEPTEDYLINVYNLIIKYPFVKCWGPGRVNVTLLDPYVPSWIASRKDMFQEKHISEVIFSNEKIWSICHPAGTGMVIEKKILAGYIESVQKGCYTLTDRLGKLLSSGGDTQIVFHAVRLGMYVGLAPDLAINHNIEPRKSTFKYLKRQIYAGCKSFMKAHNEVFADNKYELVYKDNLGVAKRIIRWIMNNYNQINKPLVALEFCGLLGSLHSPYFVVNRNPPLLLRVLIYVLIGDK
ncbi:glycosyltransferase [Spirosoma endbachense]|uniref:Glycosyltransferase n=1 Tax=Spirosoma endbachense TaxID=2666025 RepID=A0A6P1VUH1_9BACT|nr:glycosyltransferase family 2 protein [Spirosoma endbachense]QHV95279.1 glycosyltransferase [Spirosoma endbachense]